MAKPKGTPRFNPRSGDRRGKAPVGQRPSPSVWYGLAFVLVLVLVQTYYLTAPGQTISYSEFKTLLKNGELVEVTVGDQLIRGTLKQPPGTDAKQAKKFAATRVEDPKLTEELEARGVKYTGEIASRCVPALLGWILPLVFFIALYW